MLRVVATDFAFAPRRVEVVADRPVELVLVNAGTAHHHWELVDSAGSYVEGTLSHGDRQARDPVFSVPAATYEMVCSIPGHAARGMTGVLVAR